MALPPVDDAGQGYLVAQLLPGKPIAPGPKPNAFGSIADAKHRHPALGDIRPAP